MTHPFLFRKVTNRTYKSTYQVLKEISDVWDDLSDKNQAQLLEKLFGEHYFAHYGCKSIVA